MYIITSLEEADKFVDINNDMEWLDGYTIVKCHPVPSTPPLKNAFRRNDKWYVIDDKYELTSVGWVVDARMDE